MIYVESKTTKPIEIGIQGENDAREIQFNIAPWTDEYGEGDVTATAKRSQDSQPYPVTVTKDGNTVTWKPTSTDTAFAGVGSFQLEYTVDDVLAKTCIWSTMVAPSLDPAGDPPDPYDNWLAEMRSIEANAIQAADDAAASAASVAGVTSEVEDIRVGADGITYPSAGDAVRGQIVSLSEKTRNLLDVNNWSTPNSTMEVVDGVATNTVTDTRTKLILYVRTYNDNSIVDTIYSAEETVRKKVFTFTPSANANGIRLTASGQVKDLVISFNGLNMTAGTTYTLSFDITGADPTTIGGVTIENIQLELGSSETEYVPHITATDYIAREDINDLENNLPYIVDGEYASKYLLTAKDYLTKDGKYIGTGGAEAASANHIASDYILVHKDDVLTYTLRGSNNSAAVAYYYYQDKTPYEAIALGTQPFEDVTGTYTAPFNGYVRICTRVDHESPYFQIGNGGNLLGIKALIADYIANNDDYPSYWDTAVETAISDYYEKSAIVADHGVSFAYVTDTHWAFNAQNSSRLISHIFRKTNLKVAVHGGDFTRYGTDDIYGFMEYIDKSIKFLPVIGNHEYDSNLSMTRDEVYAYGFKQSETLFTHRQGFNYCYDDNAQKVRFISLNYNDANCITLLEAWATELSAGWSIVVLSHMYWESAPRGSNPTVTTIGAQIANKIDALEGTINAHFILFLVGHVHRDLDTTTSEGIPIVSTNCDAYADSQSYDWGGYKMYADDTTSQCIDLVNIDTANRKIYMTRLGVGSDRQFNY